jgi:hypothetical protein
VYSTDVHRYVLGDLQRASNVLLLLSGAGEGEVAVKSIVTDNPYGEVHYTVKEAEAVCMFNLCAMTEIGNTRNNLIGVRLGTSSNCYVMLNENKLADLIDMGYYVDLGILISVCESTLANTGMHKHMCANTHTL